MKPTIKATIVQDSFSETTGVRITTFELEYPRFIHSELMTHRVFSRNAASSRAIPIEKMLEHISNTPACPIEWGKNQAGMQAKELLDDLHTQAAIGIWNAAAQEAIAFSRAMANTGVHKQIANRITEPFQTMKTIVTATERYNWWLLRNHSDAQPEIHELAKVMLEAALESEAGGTLLVLRKNEWHVPYVDRTFRSDNTIVYSSGGNELSIEDAIKISASCCAQVSYRKLDDTLEKALAVYDRLVGSIPRHSSPFEHQATPISNDSYMDKADTWDEGVTHMDSQYRLWSNNFRGWIQNRALIEA
jgi:hypothetical protein